MSKKHRSRILEGVYESAKGAYDAGVINKVTMREFEEACRLSTVEPLPPSEILAIREKANVSQAVFARYLNVGASIVSQWERGKKQPSGAALRLLHVVRQKGIEVVLY
jgi:putative transcriptional regulator